MNGAMIRCALAAAAVMLLAPPALAQYGGEAAKPPAAAGGLPPFLAAMKRHDVKVIVYIRSADGQTRQAPAGIAVAMSIIAGGSKVKDYHGTTGDDGTTMLTGIPSNPEVQGMISYRTWADFQGVRFPHEFSGVPQDGTVVEMVVHDVTTDTASLSAEHHIEMFPDEESLVVRHDIRLYNDGPLAVNCAALPGGGLELPMPAGAKHPELHDEHNPTLEVRGTSVWYKGAMLPQGVGRPAHVQVVYTLPYGPESYEWNQPMPVRTRGVMAVVPQHKQPRAREAIPLTLVTRGAFGSVRPVEQPDDRRFQVLDSEGSTLEPGEPIRFAITNLPGRGKLNLWLLVGGILGVIGVVIFGFRRPADAEGAVMSRSHLVAERDRLVRALARMRRAVEKGKMSKARFEREREAITARLVSLYKALDRLDGK